MSLDLCSCKKCRQQTTIIVVDYRDPEKRFNLCDEHYSIYIETRGEKREQFLKKYID